MTRVLHRRCAAMLAVLAACLLPIQPITAQDTAGTHRQRTAAALAQLDLAERAAAAGDMADARTAVAGTGTVLSDLVVMNSSFREIANREFARCGTRVEELDRRIGEILTEQERVHEELDELEATLASAAERERLSAEHMREIEARMEASREAMQERLRRLDELMQWWWVPGYGAYLAIRTLADHDIDETQSLANSLNDDALRLADAQRTREAASRLSVDLAARMAADETTARELSAMHSDAFDRMRQLRGTAHFLTEAEVFWLKVGTLVEIDVRLAASDLELLFDLLSKEFTLSDFDEEFSLGTQTMREAMLSFATAVDNGSAFLLDDSTDYCGGPRRVATNDRLSRTCDVSRFTRYFEIVDPVSCSFRYLNPPGCPPEAKQVSLGAADAGRRGSWTRADDENWVGRAGTSPCLIEGAMYYGSVAAAEQCEALCQADAGCVAWTWNQRNGFMPNSINQCWGAPEGVALNLGSWTGFQSGGLR